MFDPLKHTLCGRAWILYFLTRRSFPLGSCLPMHLTAVNEFIHRIIGNFNYLFLALSWTALAN